VDEKQAEMSLRNLGDVDESQILPKTHSRRKNRGRRKHSCHVGFFIRPGRSESDWLPWTRLTGPVSTQWLTDLFKQIPNDGIKSETELDLINNNELTFHLDFEPDLIIINEFSFQLDSQLDLIIINELPSEKINQGHYY
jgi:hypothetical protein